MSAKRSIHELRMGPHGRGRRRTLRHERRCGGHVASLRSPAHCETASPRSSVHGTATHETIIPRNCICNTTAVASPGRTRICPTMSCQSVTYAFKMAEIRREITQRYYATVFVSKRNYYKMT